MPERTEKRTVSHDTEVVVGATCDGCGCELDPIWTEPVVCIGGFKRALRLTISGGYGEHHDGAERFIFCRQCADSIVSTGPMRKALEHA